MDIPEISYGYSLKFQCTKVQYQYKSKNKHYTTQYFRFEELQQQNKNKKLNLPELISNNINSNKIIGIFAKRGQIYCSQYYCRQKKSKSALWSYILYYYIIIKQWWISKFLFLWDLFWFPLSMFYALFKVSKIRCYISAGQNSSDILQFKDSWLMKAEMKRIWK